MAFGSARNTEPLRTLTLRATQCGIDIQRDFRSYDADGIRLTLHIAIGAGELFTFHLGGINHHWEFFPAGSVFGQISGALDKSQSGQTYVSGPAWALIKDACVGTENQGDWLVTQVNEPPAKVEPMSFVRPPARLISVALSGQSYCCGTRFF